MLNGSWGMPLVYQRTRSEKLSDPEYLEGLLKKYLAEILAIDKKVVNSHDSQKNSRRIARRAFLRNHCAVFLIDYVDKSFPKFRLDETLIQTIADT